MRRPGHRHSVRLGLGLESLEIRSMMSGGPALPKEILSFDAPPVATQQSTSAVITLHRQGSATALSQPLQVEVSTQAPSPELSVSYSSNLQAQASSASPGRQYQAVDELVTFPSGQATARLTVPVVYGAPNPGLLSFNIYARPSLRANVVSARSTVYLEARTDVTVPTIVGTRLLEHGSVATGIILTFNRPMDPASVENVAAYSVSDLSVKTSALDIFKLVLFAQAPRKSTPVAIKSARYDPATNSVTLTPAAPLSVTDTYQVTNSSTKAPASKANPGLPGTSTIARPLRDSTGNLLNDRGNGTAGLFQVKVV